MTDASSVTQCPHCKTAFHIGVQQLDAAGGRVRCGSCLEIFNAKEHFVVEQTHLFDIDRKSTDINASLSELDIPDDTEEEDGPIILGDYDPDARGSIPREDVQHVARTEQEDKTSQNEPSTEELSLTSEFNGPIVELDDPLDDHEREALLKDVLDTVDALDEMDSLEEWESFGTNKINPEKASESEQPSSKFTPPLLIDDETPLEMLEAEISSEEPDNTTSQREPATDKELTDVAEESESESESEELAQETELEAFDAEVNEATVTESPALEVSDGDISSRGADADAGTEMEDRPESDLISETLQEAEAEAEAEAEHDISQEEDAPSSEFFIEPDTHRKRAFKQAHWGWNAGLVALLLIFVGELLFWQPNALRKQQWFQSFTQTACTFLPCTAKAYQSIDELKISGFIEPSSELSRILTAYVELRNNATAEQDFPKIVIYFRDLRGRITASRAFTPEDYLRGEARSLDRIPINRPVQIDIDFVDPGESSTSYEFGLLP